MVSKYIIMKQKLFWLFAFVLVALSMGANLTSLAQKMAGKITLTKGKVVKVYTYTAPEDGWLVNSHIIELPTQIFIVDAQYTLDYAAEVYAYAKSLGKPITRLYITHYHPDHLMGAAAFEGIPIYALPEVKAKIEAVGDRVAREEHEKMGARINDHAEKPTQIVNPGSETVDGIHLEFIALKNAETADALMVGLPDDKILITQDLVYNKVYVFLGDHAFDSWSDDLRHFQTLPYKHIVPGHGNPGGRELYDAMLHYMAFAKQAYAESNTGDELKAKTIAAYPDYGGHPLLDQHTRFLFPKK
jgi:glyoxylase-like metal-dependent hydrolase (beta-lactamase superfamily II)